MAVATLLPTQTPAITMKKCTFSSSICITRTNLRATDLTFRTDGVLLPAVQVVMVGDVVTPGSVHSHLPRLGLQHIQQLLLLLLLFEGQELGGSAESP